MPWKPVDNRLSVDTALGCSNQYASSSKKPALSVSTHSANSVHKQHDPTGHGMAEYAKKSAVVWDFMDYWHLFRPAGSGIILVSLFNWKRVSRTQGGWGRVSAVKVIGLTSEYLACNPLVWYLCAREAAPQQVLSWWLVFAQASRR